MSLIRLYIDEDAMDAERTTHDLPYDGRPVSSFVKALRLRIVDLVTVAEAGMLSRTDEEQLRWALDNNRVIYSFNARDFYRLHTSLVLEGQEHAGIIIGQQNYSIGEQVRRFLRLILAKSAQDMRNKVEFLSAWGEE